MNNVGRNIKKMFAFVTIRLGIRPATVSADDVHSKTWER